MSLLSRPISPNCCWNCMVMPWEACQAGGENEKCLFRLLIVILLRVFLMFECVINQVLSYYLCETLITQGICFQLS